MSESPEKFIDYCNNCLENVEGFHELLSAIASIMRNPDEPIEKKVFICTDPTTYWLSHILDGMFPRGKSVSGSAQHYFEGRFMMEHASFVMIECSDIKSPKKLEVIIKRTVSAQVRRIGEANRIPPNAVVVINLDGEHFLPLEPALLPHCVILKRKPDEQPAVNPAELAEYLMSHID